MLVVTRVDSRRVLLLGVAGLVPAALVTLLLVHQPSIGARRLYPMLRGSVALVGLMLAAATVITWATAPNRLSRPSLSGLAWAGVTALLCIGPFLESTPRARLYALELESGHVAWASSRPAAAPVLVDGDLVVTDVGAGSLVGLDPTSGHERWRRRIAGGEDEPLVGRAVAAGAYVPEPSTTAPTATTTPAVEGVEVVDGHLQSSADDDDSWSRDFPGSAVLALARSGNAAYAYVATNGAGGTSAGAVVRFDPRDGTVAWAQPLPSPVAVSTGKPVIGANADAVVIAGGEQIGVLDADDGAPRWTESVVSLGKSRGYALPGAVQEIVVTDSHVFLSATPNG